MATHLPEQIIYLIIRFTASIPDLDLTIKSPRTTTTLSLKRLIRAHLPSSHSSNRIRLIYAGKVLEDTAPIHQSLKLPPPPNDVTLSNKGKGKAPVGELNESPEKAIPPVPRIYIHCSIGDALSSSELESEAGAAASAEASLISALKNSPNNAKLTSSSGLDGRIGGAQGPGTSYHQRTGATSQGFDRLLSTGFTATEVAALRSQFLTNLSFTRTPDNMPSASELRELEDRWLDSTAQDSGIGDAAAGGAIDARNAGETQGWGAGFGAEDGGLDDMLWGNIIGFFWPLGGLFWGSREEGVWSRRRQIAVFAGVLLNLVFGFLRMTT